MNGSDKQAQGNIVDVTGVFLLRFEQNRTARNQKYAHLVAGIFLLGLCLVAASKFDVARLT